MAERTIENRIKNLQVSISIAKKEKTDLLEMLKTSKGDEKLRRITRVAQLDKIIAKKEKELAPLREQRPAKNGNRSKVVVSKEEIDAAAKKYGFAQ